MELILSMRKKKTTILFFVSGRHGGGAEKVACDLMHHLDRSKYEVRLVVNKKDARYLGGLPADIVWHAFDVKNFLFLFL